MLRGLLLGDTRHGEVAAHVVESEDRSVAQLDERRDTLAIALVGHPDHGRFDDGWMGRQDVLDLLGSNVLATADKDVLLAVGDRQVALPVEAPDIAGAEPSSGQERLGVQRWVGVPDEEFGSAAAISPSSPMPTS